MRIIGIDPGSIKTGYGVIDSNGSKTSYVASGVIDAKKDSFNNRLKIIFESLAEIIKEYNPDQMAIETVFVCLLYTSPSPRDRSLSRMPSSA